MEPNPFGAIRQKLQGMTDVINLSSGDPEFPTPPHIVEAAYEAMKSGETHYTMTNGIPELRAERARCLVPKMVLNGLNSPHQI